MNARANPPDCIELGFPALLALLAVGGLCPAQPERLSVGPAGLFLPSSGCCRFTPFGHVGVDWIASVGSLAEP
jgi:hypothetical protein